MAKRAKKKTFKINKKRFISVIAIAVLLILFIIGIFKYGPKIVTAIANRTNKKEQIINKDLNYLNGTYIYNDNVKYSFNNKNFTGVLYDKENEYKFTYKISNQLITLEFENKDIETATYTAYFIDDDLKLIGGEGTLGGEYILKKEK